MKDPDALLPLSPTVYHVLLALGDEVLHGYGIMQAFSELTDGHDTLLAGTLYATLARMLEGGLVREAPEPEDVDSGGPARRYYRLTDFGRAVARAESDRLLRLIRVAEARSLVPEAGS